LILARLAICKSSTLTEPQSSRRACSNPRTLTPTLLFSSLFFLFLFLVLVFVLVLVLVLSAAVLVLVLECGRTHRVISATDW